VAYAKTLPTRSIGGDRIALGLRVKEMVGLYDHVTVTPTFDPNVNHTVVTSVQGSEMSGANSLHETGIGADLGLLMRPKGATGLSFGIVAGNIVNPGIKFRSIDTAGRSNNINIVQTTLSAGLGWEAPSGLTLAADVDNVNGGNDLEGNPTRDFRVGMEQRFLRGLALRGGYSKINGFSYGFGVFGVDVALGQKAPLELVRTLNF